MTLESGTDVATLMSVTDQARALPQTTDLVAGTDLRSLYNPEAPHSDLTVSDPTAANAFAAERRRIRTARWGILIQMVALVLGAFVLSHIVGGVTGLSPIDRATIRIYAMTWPFMLALLEGLALLKLIVQPLDVN